MDLLAKIRNGPFSQKLALILSSLCQEYLALCRTVGIEGEERFARFLTEIEAQILSPYSFEPFHRRITHPFDYTAFGLTFVEPLVDLKKSQVIGNENVAKIITQIQAKENVILFANHQTEIDPQIIHLLLAPLQPDFPGEILFVAGDRVVSDPMAIPLSIGRNLLCIYSKKYIEHPPEQREEKQLHNQRTMQRMRELLSQGGQCIYVAPSGGRDRANSAGIVEVAPFDPQSIEMFRLMGSHAERPTHFYPLSLSTYALMPPPQQVERELGEQRPIARGGAGLYFGDEIEMPPPPKGERPEARLARREASAKAIWQKVKSNYERLLR